MTIEPNIQIIKILVDEINRLKCKNVEIEQKIWLNECAQVSLGFDRDRNEEIIAKTEFALEKYAPDWRERIVKEWRNGF